MAATTHEESQKHHRIQHELSLAYASMHTFTAGANALDARAEELRAVLHQLFHISAPLRSVFVPTRTLHVRSTWGGQAATSSRRRLATQHDRCIHTLRTIDLVIDELESATLGAATAADSAHREAASSARLIHALEVQLSTDHDVAI